MKKNLQKTALIILLFLQYTITICQTIVKKNLVTDFGANPNDKLNDTEAFLKAAKYINSKNGNVKLFIPKGLYLVGKQEKRIPYKDNLLFSGIDIISLINCKNVIIYGEKDTKIKYADNLYFGCFDTITLQKPNDLNIYNPSDSKNNKLKSNKVDAYIEFSKNSANVGTFISLKYCSNIQIYNLVIDGNKSKLNLGGYWGIGNKPYEKLHYGIFVNNTQNCKLKNLKINNFGTDNLVVANYLYDDNDKINKTKKVDIDNVECTYAGRNNFSWVGGNEILVTNCKFNYAANGNIVTSPGGGISIEPEGYGNCTNGRFINCEVLNNTGVGISSGYLQDTAISFINCKIMANSNYGAYLNSPKLNFSNCNFTGSVVSYFESADSNYSTKFNNCLFTDKNCKSKDCFGGYLLGIIGMGTKLYGCKLNADFLSIINVEPVGAKSNEKVLIDKCTFTSKITKPTFMGNIGGLFRNSIVTGCIFNYREIFPIAMSTNENNSIINVKYNLIP